MLEVREGERGGSDGREGEGGGGVGEGGSVGEGEGGASVVRGRSLRCQREGPTGGWLRRA